MTQLPSGHLIGVDGKQVTSSSEVSILPLLDTNVGLCRLRNVRTFVVENHDEDVPPGAACPGELTIGDPLLKRAGLDVHNPLRTALGGISGDTLDFQDLPPAYGVHD